MEVRSFNAFESEVLNELNKLPESDRNFTNIKESVSFNEKLVTSCIESLEAKNVLVFDTKSNTYKYDSPIDGTKIILKGNILLPTTIIKTESEILVSRGAWYSFPLDFDTRRIIWNVQLNSQNKSTLVDLIRESVLKERKSKIIQDPTYKNLVNKFIPYNKTILLKINVVGEEKTDINIIFRDFINIADEEIFVEFRDFSVRSEILTENLIDILSQDKDDRDFSDIKLNRIFNFTDFIFSNNAIPYESDSETISYVKITGIKNKLELTYFVLDYHGKVTKQDVEEYIDSGEGIERLRELFNKYAYHMLMNQNFMVEVTD